MFFEFLGHFFCDLHDYGKPVNAFRVEMIRLFDPLLQKLATSDNHRKFVDEVVRQPALGLVLILSRDNHTATLPSPS